MLRQPVKVQATPIKNKTKQSKSLYFVLFFPILLFYLELVFKIANHKSFSCGHIFFFSFAAGCLCTVACTIFRSNVNRKIVIALASFFTAIFWVQHIYLSNFKDYFQLRSMLGAGGDVVLYWREALVTTVSCLPTLLFLTAPLVCYIIWGKKFAPPVGLPLRFHAIILSFALAFHLMAISSINLSKDELDRHNYKEDFSVIQVVDRFGVLTAMRLDLKYLIFGRPEGADSGGPVDAGDVTNPFHSDTTKAPDDTTTDIEDPITKPVEYGYNNMNIDFDALIAKEKNAKVKETHEYFKGLSGTKKNEYTGLFKGKNLIYMTLEGFSSKVIDRYMTPTLYKMSTEGVVLNNFYTSLWGGSTATGEYLAMTGVFYNAATCLRKSENMSLPFTMGHQLSALGYKTMAYHNNSYTYYGRNKSHPNMGYTFIAVGNGLDSLSNVWPNSDLEMAEATIGDYIDNQPFHAYYMTVSGHAKYTFTGNSMSIRHKSEVDHLPYSDNVKAYIACQLEVELMLQYLVSELDAKGILEDTVFVMSADHLPYDLSTAELSELYSLDEKGILGNFDLYRNSGIIWCASMKEPIIVDKPCSSLDLIPTVSNLFGLDYDSRLLMGTDVLSDTDPLVILNCFQGESEWNWINVYGSYNTKLKKFTPTGDKSVSDEALSKYIADMNNIVSAKRKYSLRILDLNYYKYVFGK